MDHIHLDFINQRRPAGLGGWLLLLAGLVGAATAISWDQLHWQPLNAAQEEKLRSLRASINDQRPAPRMNDAQLLAEWKRAIAAANELNLPWENLFATFEAEVARPVGILSLDPDASKRELILTGEAKNLEEMLAYYRLLQQQPIFSNVTIHTHQINRQDRENPIHFRVTAKWAVNS